MTLINLKFYPEMEKAILEGREYCIIGDELKGYPGDIFIVRDRLFRILQVDFPNISRDSLVYIHYFAYVCDKCPLFGISGAVCSDPDNLCPIYEECKEARK